ncbi:RES family NAD+ phosphorylase [Methylobacterium marchantiae]|uniref:RES family NAD+ phosphorylase n=1 Tax=Methylobacterium marchantiae TaxID=600331 RepID=A0ABW3WUD0_9HYPH|nr:hypothetical protein AIGOOFII_0635 [Methylobacterium marchantiae]
MRLDPATLADLALAFLPDSYVRACLLAHRATPLGMGHGTTRFSSPVAAFKLLYIAEDLQTALAETMIRDRFENRVRRRIGLGEVTAWGATEVSANAPLTLIDLRTTGLLRLGVSTDAGRAKAHRLGRVLSAAIYDRTDADGVLYLSRLTSATCCAVYERGVGKLSATPVEDVVTLEGLVPALRGLDVEIVR